MVTFNLNMEMNPELKQPVIKTVSKAEGLAEQLKDFAQFYGHEVLSGSRQSQQFASPN